MLKYIIIREHAGSEYAVLCLAPTKHSEMAYAQQAYRSGRTIVAAGFVEYHGHEARTYGFSESLDLGPRPEDARFLSVFAKATADAAAAAIALQAAPLSR